MRTVAYTDNLPIDDDRALVDVELDDPSPGPGDVLVEVEAVSVNPVDHKLRLGQPTDGPTVLGFDGAGTVAALGEGVGGFAVGDAVFWAGQIDRPGSNAELELVDHRVLAHRPATLDAGQAAALPLTAITAWESLFEVLGLRAGALAGGDDGVLLVTAAAGGVGSIALQLARALTGARIIGTASRPQSAAWARGMGAHEVVDHHGDLAAAVLRLAPGGVDRVLSLSHTETHFAAFAALTRPRGHICAIDEPEGLDTLALKDKVISFTWEFMGSRTIQQTDDVAVQGRILADIARLVDRGLLRTTETTRLEGITAASLREAHRLVESGSTIGKVVVVR